MLKFNRRAYILATILWMALIFYFSSIPDLKSTLPTAWDLIFRKIAHFLEFGVLYLLLREDFKGYRYAAKAAFLGAFLYALSDELHQSFIPHRVPSPLDVAVDTAGILTALIVRRQWHTKKQPQ